MRVRARRRSCAHTHHARSSADYRSARRAGGAQRRLRGVSRAVGGNISAAVAQAVGGNFKALSGFAAQEMCRLCVGRDACARATQELCAHASRPE